MTTTLVTGATGTIGSTLVPLLAAAEGTVRALIRDPHRSERRWDARVEVRVGDFADRASLRSALDGADSVFLLCGNVPGQVDYECALIDEAVRAGVGQVVKLSARGAALGAPVAFWHWHALIEAHLQASGLPHVVLRPGFLMTNLLAATDQVRTQHALFAPAGAARIAMIDPADVAAVAAVALTGDGHHDNTYEITGPEAIGYQRVADDLSAATGQPVGYVDIPPAAAREALTTSGVPPFAVEQLLNVFEALRNGAQADPTGTVEAVIGRPPRPFATFARGHAAAFRSEQVGSVAG